MTLNAWLLRYAEAGWRVYPVEPGQKKAIFTGWQASATTDSELIARQWRGEPYPNVGLICGESFAVFDIEAPHLSAFFEYLDTGGYVLPETPVSATGRGGLHIYVRPVARVITTRKLRLANVHIGEFKTTGGVLAPPSRTIGEYRWLWWPDDPSPAAAPVWLTSLISDSASAQQRNGVRKKPADPATALDALAVAVRDSHKGNRNNLLHWAACRAAEEGIRADIAASVLRRAALVAGLDDDEARATITSGLSGSRPGPP